MSRQRDPAVGSADAGMVIVAVLWLLGLLAALTLAMSVYTTNTLAVVDLHADRLRVDALILAGVELAAARLQSADHAVQGAGSYVAPDAEVAFDYRDESARIDLNAAPRELLAGLFAALGARQNDASTYAERIVALRQPQLGLPPDAAVRARTRFVDVMQLLQVPGVPQGLALRATRFLTVYSGIGQIDPAIAAPEVLASAPGMTRERVRSVLGLLGRGRLDPQALADAAGSAQSYMIQPPGRATRIRVTAASRDGFTTSSEVVVLHYDDDDQPYRILSWEDDVGAAAVAGVSRR